jgi:hypothetical protein
VVTEGHGTKVRQLRATSRELRVASEHTAAVCLALKATAGFVAGWIAFRRLLEARGSPLEAYFDEFAAIFFTMASTSLRSLSFRFVA